MAAPRDAAYATPHHIMHQTAGLHAPGEGAVRLERRVNMMDRICRIRRARDKKQHHKTTNGPMVMGQLCWGASCYCNSEWSTSAVSASVPGLLGCLQLDYAGGIPSGPVTRGSGGGGGGAGRDECVGGWGFSQAAFHHQFCVDSSFACFTTKPPPPPPANTRL